MTIRKQAAMNGQPTSPDCQHDWMPIGSREVCIKCDKARMRNDLPAWEFDKRGAVVTSSKPKTKRRGR